MKNTHPNKIYCQLYKLIEFRKTKHFLFDYFFGIKVKKSQTVPPTSYSNLDSTKSLNSISEKIHAMNDIENTSQFPPDILLVTDSKHNTVNAVSGITESSELKTITPTSDHQNQFLKIDKHGDLFSNFFSNFLSQLKNPTSFTFFRIPLPDVEILSIKLQDAINDPREDAADFINQYKITNQNTFIMSTNTPSSEKEYQYSTDQIDWKTMSKFGLDQEKLEKLNVLDSLLRGFKTNSLVPVTINLGTAVSRMDVRLSLQTNDNGQVVVNLHGIRKEPNLNFKFLGHEFTEEDKKNLLEVGNMGRVVNLVNPKTDEIIPSVISRDRLTNELVAYRSEFIKIPEEIKGIKLSEHQQQTLLEGKPLYVEGMISKKGEAFDATLQFNADKKYVEFIFNNDGQQSQSQNNAVSPKPTQEVPRTFRGKELNDDQYGKFKAGQTIYIDGLLDKKEQPYQGYITFNPENGKIDFEFPNQYKERMKPTEAHKTQTAVNSEGKTNEATNKIKEPLKAEQQSPKNKAQQDQQEKPKVPARSKGRKI